MNKLEELKAKKEKYLTILKEKRLMLGESDGAMVSQAPSGRFELEEEIQMYQTMIDQIQSEIDKLSS
jgi:hypothetical protein